MKKSKSPMKKSKSSSDMRKFYAEEAREPVHKSIKKTLMKKSMGRGY